MNQKNKIIFLSSLIIGVLTLTLGVTFAIFNFSKTSTNSKLIVGNIYMHYNEGSQGISLLNAIPSLEYDNNSYFEFTVDGKNTYQDKPIYYEIDLTLGDDIEDKIRIDSNLLTFRLTEFKNDVEEEIFHNRSYSDLTNKRIHVDTISSTDGTVNRKYRLYMKIGDYTKIGNTEDVDYTIEEWNKIYASVKVKVVGDFEEKTIETPASCFGYNIVYNDQKYAKTVQATFTLNDISSDSAKLKTCTDYIVVDLYGAQEGTSDYEKAYPIYEPLCKGETVGDGIDIKQFFNLLSSQGLTIDYNYLESEGIISDYSVTEKYLNSSTNEELDLNSIDKSQASIEFTSYNASCGADVVMPRAIVGINVTSLNANGNYSIFFGRKGEVSSGVIKNIVLQNNIINIEQIALSRLDLRNIEIPNSVTTIEYDAFSSNQLTSVTIPNSVTTIGETVFAYNQLTSVEIPDSVTTIGSSAFIGNQLTSVVIPNSVTTIGTDTFRNNQLTSVTIPDSVTTIESSAFRYNQLTSITIPDSVTTIGFYAFSDNQLTNISIGSGIQYISWGAFEKASYSNPNLSSITINRSCSDIKNIPESSTNSTKYYPWLSDSSPFTASGVTIYGTGSEVCDSY